MNYRSPIELIQSQLCGSIEGEIYKAVIGVGVHVDKAELMKALQYDRNQYIKGYKDREDQIVRCQECKYRYFADNRIPCEQKNVCGRNGIVVTPDWFCADGERNET